MSDDLYYFLAGFFGALIVLFLIFLSASCFAGELTLTPSEMTKLSQYFHDDHQLIWKGDALFIELPLTQEKRLVFPSHVSVDMKGALDNSQMKALANDRSLYLTALKPISKTRIFATLPESNQVILLDIATSANASADTTTIQMENPNAQNKGDHAVKSNDSELTTTQFNELSNTKEISYAGMVRFAWQQLFAPERMLAKLPHYQRVPMHTEMFIRGLFYGDRVLAHPIASWQINQFIVTAVELQNLYAHSVTLQIPRDLCGQWLALSFYPYQNLAAHGKAQDRTTLFLVSKSSFANSVRICHVNA